MSKPGILKKSAANPIAHFLRSSAVTRPNSASGSIQPDFRKVPLGLPGILVVAVAGLAPFPFPNDEAGNLTRPVPWMSGERLQYTVSWANFVAAGELTLDCQEVSEPGKARLYRFGVRAHSVDWVQTLFLNVNDFYEAQVDQGTLLPLQAQARLEHGNKLEKNSILFDHQNRIARLSSGQTQPLALNTYDAASLMFILRTLELGSGKTQVLRLLHKETVYTLRAEDERTESVRVGQKDYQVNRVAIKQLENGIAQDTLRIRLYLTSDSRRLPVLMTAEPAWGTIRVELS